MTPEHRLELLKIAADIQEDIAKLQVAEAAAIESQRVATRNKELIQQKQAADAATKVKAEKAADEEAFNNADTSAYPACPAADEMLPPDGVGFRNWLDLQVGQQIIDVTFACVQKAGFTVHEVVPGKEPAYEAALKKCAIIQSAYYARCANEIPPQVNAVCRTYVVVKYKGSLL